MKNITLTILSLILTFTINAQEKGSDIFFNLGGSMHRLAYSTPYDASKGAMGFTINGGYNYFFSKSLGISLGIGMNSFGSSGVLDGLMTSPSVDMEGADYEHRNYFTLWTEKQSSYMLGLPFGIIYRHPIAKKTGLSATIGVKYLIPLKATYEVTGGNLVSTGYYSQWNVELENLPQYGFPMLSSKPSGEVKLKSGLSLYADLGFLYRFAESRYIYFGGYLDYGITNIAKSQETLPFGSKGTYTSILAVSDAVNKIIPVSYGLKLGINLNMKNKIREE